MTDVVASQETHSSVDLYKQFCYEEGCKPNSSFLMYLQDRGGTLHFERLSCNTNYLGPKGLLPVIRLMDRCQTLQSLSLNDNGADNQTVERLCEMVERHLGITSISLRGNPISQQGGRRILRMVETCPRITYIDVSSTDIYEALQQAIYSTVERHSKYGQESAALHPSDAITRAFAAKTIEALPPLQRKKDHASISITPAEQQSLKSRSMSPADRAALLPRPPSSSNRRRPGSPASAAAGGAGDNASIPTRDDEHSPASIGSPVTNSAKRMPAEQLRRLRAKFVERTRLYDAYLRSPVTEAANRVRVELMMLERPSGLQTETAMVPHPPVSTASTTAEKECKEASGDEQDTEDGKSIQTTTNATESQPCFTPPSTAPPETLAVSINSSQQHHLPSPPASDCDFTGNTSPVIPTGIHSLTTTMTEGPMFSSEEQFQVLFDQGCREYQHHRLDEAYVAWNEAMNIAVAKKNREWIALITSNLQHLTYEILVKEGEGHLEKGSLEEADQCFERAYGVACKCNNGHWQSEMTCARQNVKCATFYKFHKAALQLLSLAESLEERDATPDDYYILPTVDMEGDRSGEDSENEKDGEGIGDEGRRIMHSRAFVNEWPRIRMVWESVGLWVDAAKAARQVSTALQGGLLQVLHDGLTKAASFLIRTHFDSPFTAPRTVSWQGCWQFTYHECVKLSELYVDIIGYHQQHLHHDLLSCVADLYLGNLALSTYELSLAYQRFYSAQRSARRVESESLEATALTFCATVNMQRAHYATAERELLDARGVWERIISASLNGNEVQTSPSSRERWHSGQKVGSHAEACVAAAISLKDYAVCMTHAGNRFLLTILSSTYRYKEALELLEYGLLHGFHDLLMEKLQTNFSLSPSLAQLVGVAGALHTSLVYYATSDRFVWSVAKECYEMEEKLLIWVVPREGEMRYVELCVSKEHHSTIDRLVAQAREGMMADPPPGVPSDAILTRTHRRSWMTPLEQLYAIFFDPIISYIRSSELPYDPQNIVITIVPTGSLWSVPFNVLMNRNGRFAVEDIGIQFAFSATQAHFALVSTERVRERGLQRSVVGAQLEMPGDTAGAPVCDYVRSNTEAECILSAIATEKGANTTEQSNDEIVRDVVALKTAMPTARTLHLALATSSTHPIGPEESLAAIHVPMYATEDQEAHMAILSSSELCHMELFAEVVTLSNTSIHVNQAGRLVRNSLDLTRALLCAGTPCVMLGQWCTPDMCPEKLFACFYKNFWHGSYITAGSSHSFSTGDDHAQQKRNLQEVASVHDGSRNRRSNTVSIQDVVTKHKATILAESVREVIKDPAMRYCPRAWGGYICLGSGLF